MKYYYLLFEPRLWSAYNYWCNPAEESRCDPRNFWALPRFHNRSVAAFHDRVTAGHHWKEALSGRVGIVSERRKTHWLPVIEYRNTCEYGKSIYRTLWQQAESAFGEERILTIAQPMLEDQPEEVWKAIVRKLEYKSFPERHRGIREFKSVRYNTQKQKGVYVSVKSASFTAGTYAISGNKEILPATRYFLDACWFEDCLWASSMTGYNFSACNGKQPELKVGVSISRHSSE